MQRVLANCGCLFYSAINSTRSCLDLNLEFCEVPFTFNVASAVTIDSLETAICSGESPLLRPRTDRVHLLDSWYKASFSVLSRYLLVCSFASGQWPSRVHGQRRLHPGDHLPHRYGGVDTNG